MLLQLSRIYLFSSLDPVLLGADVDCTFTLSLIALVQKDLRHLIIAEEEWNRMRC